MRTAAAAAGRSPADAGSALCGQSGPVRRAETAAGRGRRGPSYSAIRRRGASTQRPELRLCGIVSMAVARLAP